MKTVKHFIKISPQKLEIIQRKVNNYMCLWMRPDVSVNTSRHVVDGQVMPLPLPGCTSATGACNVAVAI